MQTQTNPLTLSDLQRKVSWLFYGTRTYSGLDSTDQAIVDEIIQDGYDRFLRPPPLPDERQVHRWGFLRPYLTIVTEADNSDYGLPENFGGLEGDLFYGSSDQKQFPLTKTYPERIMLWRQRSSSSSRYPTHYAIVEAVPSQKAPSTSKIMLWPTPDGAYTLTGRMYIFTPPLNTANPYPVCDQYHRKTLEEAVLSVAEERLEDGRAMHAELFLENLRASIYHDRDKYASDHLGIDFDRSDGIPRISTQGDYVTYNGYTPGA